MFSKDVLRGVVYQQKASGFGCGGTVRRGVLGEVLKWLGDDRVLVLSGLRRCGKSTVLRQVMASLDGFSYVNFEDERFTGFKASDFESLNEVLSEAYGRGRTYFFDEIQNIRGFESFVRRLQDSGSKVVITGSNASLLSRELGTKLTGRYRQFEVYPFSFREYLTFHGALPSEGEEYLTEKKADIISHLKKYLVVGGLPEYLKNHDLEYVQTLYENILYRDVVVRYSIRMEKTVKELASLLATNIASEFTYNSAKKTLGLSNAITVKEYVSYLGNSYLFFELPRFHSSAKKQLASPRKIYSVDPAFKAILGTNFQENLGRSLENVVFLELKRRKASLNYYSGKNECDFIVSKSGRPTQAIQVCHTLDETNMRREVEGLVEAMEKLRLKDGLILTLEQEDEINEGNRAIPVMPAWKWLLQTGEKEAGALGGLMP